MGSPQTYPHMAAGWAVAGDTPFTWTKQVASNYGGTRDGMIISWPGDMADLEKVRSQWFHVIDVVPTVLEAAKLPQPTHVDGVKQEPIEGGKPTYYYNFLGLDFYKVAAPDTLGPGKATIRVDFAMTAAASAKAAWSRF
jgi:Sulfatase